MRFNRQRTPEQIEEVNRIIDEALVEWNGSPLGASLDLRKRLTELEGFGVEWAWDELYDATTVGLMQVVRNRQRSLAKIAVAGQTMSATYVTAKGPAFWLTSDIDDLEPTAERMERRGGTLTEHAGIFEMARSLCIKHGVRTPAEAFAAEGIDVVQVAA